METDNRGDKATLFRNKPISEIYDVKTVSKQVISVTKSFSKNGVRSGYIKGHFLFIFKGMLCQYNNIKFHKVPLNKSLYCDQILCFSKAC